jgi:hypothetical protein
MGPTAGQFIEELARRYRVLVIGGLAVIAHGFNRPTKDADVWLEPLVSPSAWADALEQVCCRFPGLTLHTLPGWRQVAGPRISAAAEKVGMVRILGLDCPLDIFRQPNEFPPDSFDEVFSRVDSIWIQALVWLIPRTAKTADPCLQAAKRWLFEGGIINPRHCRDRPWGC